MRTGWQPGKEGGKRAYRSYGKNPKRHRAIRDLDAILVSVS